MRNFSFDGYDYLEKENQERRLTNKKYGGTCTSD